MPRRTKSETVPEAMKLRYDEIVAAIDAFCEEHLNAEYAQVCRQMAATLARKRPSPLLGGRPNTWAAAIVHTVGSVNFLFDKTQTPHIRADDLAECFGLSKSTVGIKSKQIKDILNISVFDSDWTLPSRIDGNPVAWLISVNGFILDARYAPRSIQEEAYRKGLIPYLPGSAEDNA
jgi:hypothetical protein